MGAKNKEKKNIISDESSTYYLYAKDPTCATGCGHLSNLSKLANVLCTYIIMLCYILDKF